jgi:hypothetical protein
MIKNRARDDKRSVGSLDKMGKALGFEREKDSVSGVHTKPVKDGKVDLSRLEVGGVPHVGQPNVKTVITDKDDSLYGAKFRKLGGKTVGDVDNYRKNK